MLKLADAFGRFYKVDNFGWQISVHCLKTAHPPIPNHWGCLTCSSFDVLGNSSVQLLAYILFCLISGSLVAHSFVRVTVSQRQYFAKYFEVSKSDSFLLISSKLSLILCTKKLYCNLSLQDSFFFFHHSRVVSHLQFYLEFYLYSIVLCQCPRNSFSSSSGSIQAPSLGVT